MTASHKFTAFSAGLVAALSLIWPTTLCAQTENGGAIHACVGPDRVLRRVQLQEPCPAGQRSLYLAEPEDEEENEPEEDTPEPEKPPVDPRIRDLEIRVTALKNRPRSRLKAPFEVVDQAGKPILRVEPGAVRFYDGGKQVAVITLFDDGAFFTVGGSESLKASFGASSGMGGFFMSEGGKSRLELGKGEKGNFRLVFLTPDEKQVAGIGESAEGTGAARIGSSDGALKASMQLDKGARGAFRIFNAGGNALLSLTQGDNPGGLLEIGDSGSEPMVKAGVSSAGSYGVVLAGPASIFPATGLGLPGSYLLGAAQGK
jgi:hypothetical protein